MIQKNSPFRSLMRLARSYWIGIVAMGIAALVLLANQAAWAAPLNQTVPPRPTDTPTSAPQATNTPRDKDEEEEQQPPTPTPTPTSAQPSQTQAEGLTGVVTADRLNVREGPGRNFTIVGTVLRDETVTILGRNEAGSWWRICCVSGTTTEGWVSAPFIRPNFDAAQANALIPVVDAAPAAAPTTAPTPTSAPTTAVAATTDTVTPTMMMTTTVAATTAMTIMTNIVTEVVTDVTEVVTPTFSLELAINQVPAFVQQGQEVELQFVITNSGDITALNVEIRNELAPDLIFVAAEIPGNGTLEEQTGNEGRFVFSIRWPELAPGESMTASVTLQIAEEVADGAVIDNLAVASADNALPYTAGISIGMPPTMLPDFQ